MFEASAVIELRFFSKGDVWCIIMSFFRRFLEYIPPERNLGTSNLQKIPFYHGTDTYEEYQEKT